MLEQLTSQLVGITRIGAGLAVAAGALLLGCEAADGRAISLLTQLVDDQDESIAKSARETLQRLEQ